MNRRQVVLDTDVASSLFVGRLEPRMAACVAGAELIVTFVTLGELMRWPEANQWGGDRRSRLERWVEALIVLHSDELIAHQWARSTGRALVQGSPRPDNDAWIAACCRVYDLPLATFNVKDFAYHVEHDELVLVG